MSRIHQIVLDTNVFLAGIFWPGPPYQILKAWQTKQIELILSLEILEGYNRVFEILTQKYPPINLTSFTDLVMQEGKFFEPIRLHEQISNDPDDDKFIACSLAADVDYLISGDKDLLSVSGYQGLKIIKPRDFVDKHIAIHSQL